MTPDERRARAARLREKLDDPDIKDAFADAETQIVNQWKACHTTDERENLWRAMHILRLVWANLSAMAVGEPDGTMSAIKRAK